MKYQMWNNKLLRIKFSHNNGNRLNFFQKSMCSQFILSVLNRPQLQSNKYEFYCFYFFIFKTKVQTWCFKLIYVNGSTFYRFWGSGHMLATRNPNSKVQQNHFSSLHRRIYRYDISRSVRHNAVLNSKLAIYIPLLKAI